MKYKYLGTRGSMLQIRLVLAVPIIIGITLIISFFFDGDREVGKVLFGIYILFAVYILSRFSTVKYNSTGIVIQNIMGETHYSKDELLTVKPLRPYLNLYSIVFNNNKSYVFGLPSSRIMLAIKGTEVAEKMKMELLSTETSQ